tara:strand:- start:2048 stop:3334 length:1287 start_codon:yes stop_codon:yes gene_type:complete
VKNKIQKYLDKLFYINRSITGKGNRQTLKILKDIVPLNIKEIKSGKKVYDWTIPKEWNIKDAFIKDRDGNRLVSFKENNLHVISYSRPINKTMNWHSLKKKLFFSKVSKDAIPYRTTYYNDSWGFCVSKRQYEMIGKAKGPYKVVISSSLINGSLTYGDYVIKGKSKKEILISTYICHPSMANDCLSGLILTAFLARSLSKKRNKWTYRFVFVPETIGAIAYCSLNKKKIQNTLAGMVITTVGGPGKFGYKQSWQSEHQINRDIEKIFKQKRVNYIKYPFSIRGSDERQYSSQAFKLNMATITKDKYFEYKEYHTSLDNLNFVNGRNIYKSLNMYKALLNQIDRWKIFQSRMPYCEHMMSKHNLYPKTGGLYRMSNTGLTQLDIIQWILHLSDGMKTIDEIAAQLRVSKATILKLSQALKKKKLLIEL